MIKFMLLCALLTLTSGCAGSFEEARNPKVALGGAPQSARCNSLDSGHRDWSASAMLSAVVAGGTGASMLPEPVRKENAAVIPLAAASLGAAGWSAFSTAESNGFATAWARECSR
jgi:hypothetical protein